MIVQGKFVPIRPFLSSRVFEPEAISEMSAAFERACAELKLKLIDDIATRLVAEKVIELAERRVVGVEALSSQAVQELLGRE
jgi:hypothetical protein